MTPRKDPLAAAVERWRALRWSGADDVCDALRALAQKEPTR